MTKLFSHFLLDGVVHAVIDGYRSMGYYTRCGVQVDPAVNTVMSFLSQDRPLTCIRCAGGAVDGHNLRQELKTLTFAAAYSKSTNAAKLGIYAYQDALMTLALAGIYPRSTFGRCKRLAKKLFSKAVSYA